MDFKAVFQLLIESFRKAGVDFALIGGFALHSAGYTRATQDIDFLVAKEDAPKVKSILLANSYELLHESEDVSNFSSPIGALGRVDFLYAHRKYTRGMLQRAPERDFLNGALKVKIIVPEDLIGLKVQSSSNDANRYHQDMADIEAVIRANRDKLNMALIREYFELFQRGKELDGILERLNHA